MNRRQFIGVATYAALGQTEDAWGGPVIDIHLHPRKEAGVCFAHNEGSGATKAVLLTHINNSMQAQAEIDLHPDRFIWFAAIDPLQAGAFDALRKALEGGAKGVGEMKNRVAANSKEMARIYDLCAEMNVPITIHFQEPTDTQKDAGFNTGYETFDRVLKSHPNTTFIGHADFFWANVSADVPLTTNYPSGKIKPGGLTDRWLATYPNLYADMSANSGNNALTRDPDFARDFVQRHRAKLMFGSDCSCRDGRGTGGSPLLPRLKGKCVGRDTLTELKALTTPELFRQITWTNATALLKIKS